MGFRGQADVDAKIGFVEGEEVGLRAGVRLEVDQVAADEMEKIVPIVATDGMKEGAWGTLVGAGVEALGQVPNAEYPGDAPVLHPLHSLEVMDQRGAGIGTLAVPVAGLEFVARPSGVELVEQVVLDRGLLAPAEVAAVAVELVAGLVGVDVQRRGWSGRLWTG